VRRGFAWMDAARFFFIMSDPTSDNSLILPESQQMDLIPQSEIMALELKREEADGTFTGARLFKQHPEKYADCIALLAEGCGIRRTARLLKVSPNTVRAVRDREPDAIDTVKERIANQIKHGAEMLVEGILEDLDDDTLRKKIATRDKGVLLGILSEKYLLMAGQATSIVDVRGAEPDHDAFNKQIAGLKTADATVTGNPGAGGKQKAESRPNVVAGVIEADFTEADAEPADGAESEQNGGSGIPDVVVEGENEGE